LQWYFQANIKRDYECHVITKYPGKLAYPSSAEADLERLVRGIRLK
jgi:hypothetical protein